MKKILPGIVVLLMVVAAVPAMDREKAPVPAGQIVIAQPFIVESGYVNLWHKEKPVVSSGYVVVLRVGRELAEPRAIVTPVLFGGNGPVERIDNGRTGEYIVGLVPGDFDLADTLFWFGDPGYPAQQGWAEIEDARWRAVEAGITSLSVDSTKSALAAGGEPIRAADKVELLDLLEPLVDRYSPKERTD